MAVLVRRRDLAAPPIQRYQPFPEIHELQEQLGQLMEHVMSAEDGGVWVPNVDIEETEDAWVVEAEVPGVKREDADVEVRDSEVVISGEIKERERKGVLRRNTRRVGRFDYRVTLPAQVDPKKIDAKLSDGVLSVRFPMAEQAKRQRIEVKAD